jgi:hypothetical protein
LTDIPRLGVGAPSDRDLDEIGGCAGRKCLSQRHQELAARGRAAKRIEYLPGDTKVGPHWVRDWRGNEGK